MISARLALFLGSVLVMACSGDPLVASEAGGSGGAGGSASQAGAAGAPSGGSGGQSGASGSNTSQGGSGQGGAAGDSGASGAAGGGQGGAAGESGASGQGGAGASGQAGMSGASGQAGAAGVAGQAGMSGASGQSGVGGQAGSSGASGQAGQGGGAGAAGSGAGGGAGQGGAAGDGGVAGDGGAAGDAGAAGDGGAAGSAGDGGAGGGGPELVIYVDAKGQGDGTSPDSPLASLSDALALAATVSSSRILVCKGAYGVSSTLTLPAGAQLLGGHSCGDFAPPAAPSDPCVDGTKAVVVQGENGVSPVLRVQGTSGVISDLHVTGKGQTVLALDVTPGSFELRNSFIEQLASDSIGATRGVSIVGGAPLVSGNCIAGGKGGSENGNEAFASAAVRVISADGAASGAVLSGNTLKGGQGAGLTSHGSVGVAVINSSPEITANTIMGGAGKTTAPERIGSVGVLVVSTGSGPQSNPRIHQNPLIDGGTGTFTVVNGFSGKGTGSVGVALFASPDAPGIVAEGEGAIAGNTIVGGKADLAGGDGGLALPAVGVVVSASASDTVSVELVDNVIHGSTGQTGAFKRGPRAVVYTLASGVIARNSILGCRDYPGGVLAGGVELIDTSGVVVQNNMIHGGRGSTLFGVAVRGGKNTWIRHNTVAPGVEGAKGYGLFVSDEGASSGVTGLRVENNVLVGTNDSQAAGVLLAACSSSKVAAIAGNTFVNAKNRAIVHDNFGSSTCNKNNAFWGSNYSAETCGTGCVVEKNQDVIANQSECNGVNNCVSNPSCWAMLPCTNTYFEGWSNNEKGIETLLSGQGWKFNTCDLAFRGAKPVVGVTDDRFGTLRPVEDPARGAHEPLDCGG